MCAQDRSAQDHASVPVRHVDLCRSSEQGLELECLALSWAGCSSLPGRQHIGCDPSTSGSSHSEQDKRFVWPLVLKKIYRGAIWDLSRSDRSPAGGDPADIKEGGPGFYQVNHSLVTTRIRLARARASS